MVVVVGWAHSRQKCDGEKCQQIRAKTDYVFFEPRRPEGKEEEEEEEVTDAKGDFRAGCLARRVDTSLWRCSVP